MPCFGPAQSVPSALQPPPTTCSFIASPSCCLRSSLDLDVIPQTSSTISNSSKLLQTPRPFPREALVPCTSREPHSKATAGTVITNFLVYTHSLAPGRMWSTTGWGCTGSMFSPPIPEPGRRPEGRAGWPLILLSQESSHLTPLCFHFSCVNFQVRTPLLSIAPCCQMG